jgi:hypothetical protein
MNVAKQKSKTVRRMVELPKGFKAISAGGDSWHPKKVGDSITGVLVGVKEVKFPAEKRGTKIVRPARSVKVYNIKTATGDMGVWGSAGLKALAEVKKGKRVFIHFDGMGRAKPGQSAPRLYTVAMA